MKSKRLKLSAGFFLVISGVFLLSPLLMPLELAKKGADFRWFDNPTFVKPSEANVAYLHEIKDYIDKKVQGIPAFYHETMKSGSGRGVEFERALKRSVAADCRDLFRMIEYYNGNVSYHNRDVNRYIAMVMRYCSGLQYAGVEKTFPAYIQEMNISGVVLELRGQLGFNWVDFQGSAFF